MSGAVAPALDAPVVRSEAVLHAPEDRLRATAGVDLAIDRADVGLHGVGAEVGQVGYLRVAHPLGDERQDLGFAVGQPLASAWPVEPRGTAHPVRWVADDHLARVHG